MAKEKDAIPVNVGLGDVEVTANQGYQQRVKDIVNKFGKYLNPFAKVGLAALLALPSRRFKPFDLGDLDHQQSQLEPNLVIGNGRLPSGLA